MDNLPRQTTDGKLIAPYLWGRSDANRFVAAMGTYDREPEQENDERSAKDEAYAGLVIAENLVTYYGTAEERIERGFRKVLQPGHFDGYVESLEKVLKMSGEQLLMLLDELDGRNNLPNHCTHQQLKDEALRQHETEWRLPERPANQNQFARVVLLTVQKRDVIAEREALKKAERAAQPKTEWLEELDEVAA